MKLNDAAGKLEKLIGRRFSQVFSQAQLEDIIKNKGKSGQILEIALGLQNSSKTLDFEDGELKTNKCNKSGRPLETMFITQINSIIDELLESRDFYNTHIYKKIKNLLYVPISKEGNPKDWMFLSYVHVNLEDKKFSDLLKQIEKDYYSVCNQLKSHIETSSDGFIHTSSGKFIQIRSKDSKPYRSIYSKIYGREVSNKNHAFYFQKDFMNYIKTM